MKKLRLRRVKEEIHSHAGRGQARNQPQAVWWGNFSTDENSVSLYFLQGDTKFNKELFLLKQSNEHTQCVMSGELLEA